MCKTNKSKLDLQSAGSSPNLTYTKISTRKSASPMYLGLAALGTFMYLGLAALGIF